MKKCKKIGQAFLAFTTDRFGIHGPVEFQFVGKAPRNTPYVNIEDRGGRIVGSISGVRDLKQLRRAINLAIGDTPDAQA